MKRKTLPLRTLSYLTTLWLMIFIFLAVVPSASGDVVKIMPLGDSLTSGYMHRVSYRYDLWFKLVNAGFDVDFVGSLRHAHHEPNLDWYPEYLTTFDRDHEGYSGFQTHELVEIIRRASAVHQPDIVLVLAGVNDIWVQGAGGATNARFRLRDIIEDIRDFVPGVTILLGLMHPYTGQNSEYIESLNDAIATVASDLDTSESPVVLVDHYTGFDIEGMTFDGLHHNRAGEAWIADNWFEVLVNIWPESEPFQINAGHSGAWYNPDTVGQGQLVDIEPESKFLFLSWFTFTDGASGDPNEQHWFTAQGNYSDDSADLVVYETLGGRFDDPQAVDTEPVGTASLNFSDCGTGQLDYVIDAWDLQGSVPLLRAIPGTENVCEELSGNTTGSLQPNDGRDGAWFDENAPGQGFLIDAHPNAEGNDFIFVAWFTYGEGTSSGQRWLTAQGPLQGLTADIVVYQTLSGRFNDPKPSETNAVGTMTIDFTDCSNALLSYSITDEDLAGSIDIKRAIPGTEALCQEITNSE